MTDKCDKCGLGLVRRGGRQICINPHCKNYEGKEDIQLCEACGEACGEAEMDIYSGDGEYLCEECYREKLEGEWEEE